MLCAVPCEDPVNCLVDPCVGTTCQRFPDAVCVSDYCGGCNARFFQDGQEVQCEGEQIASYCTCDP